MAGVWDRKIQKVIVSTDNVGTNNNFNARLYRDVALITEFVVNVSGFAPNTDYKIFQTQLRTANADLGNNQGYNAEPLESDIPDLMRVPEGTILGAYSSPTFTTDSSGNAQVTFVADNNNYLYWQWSTSSTNFHDGESPDVGDNMSLCLYNVSLKTSRYWNSTDKFLSLWDSVLKENPAPRGYQTLETDEGSKNLTTFTRVTTMDLEVRGTSGNVIGSGNRTRVQATIPWAFEVGAFTYTQNENDSYDDPQISINLSIESDETTEQEWSPVADINCSQPIPTEAFFYSDAIKRDFAAAATDNLQIHTLEIYCEKDPQNETYFICNDMESHILTIESGSTHEFQASNFSFTLPSKDVDGAPEMQVAMSNINGEVSNYINRVRDYGTIVVKYRLFLASDKTTPQTDNPLRLFLTEVNIDPFQVTGRVSFVDTLNKSFPSVKYNISNFPNIYS